MNYKPTPAETEAEHAMTCRRNRNGPAPEGWRYESDGKIASLLVKALKSIRALGDEEPCRDFRLAVLRTDLSEITGLTVKEISLRC